MCEKCGYSSLFCCYDATSRTTFDRSCNFAFDCEMKCILTKQWKSQHLTQLKFQFGQQISMRKILCGRVTPEVVMRSICSRLLLIKWYPIICTAISIRHNIVYRVKADRRRRRRYCAVSVLFYLQLLCTLICLHLANSIFRFAGNCVCKQICKKREKKSRI